MMRPGWLPRSPPCCAPRTPWETGLGLWSSSSFSSCDRSILTRLTTGWVRVMLSSRHCLHESTGLKLQHLGVKGLGSAHKRLGHWGKLPPEDSSSVLCS
uniref:uncharacterized protein LOC128928571 isoform X2 n=1 Tax=Callithrix jacchus TaxID=9483 RepID=UPI0023DD2ECF|nr:uncharacterized protein LOC128928571 isoform X2 [Callithrix jacchus]